MIYFALLASFRCLTVRTSLDVTSHVRNPNFLNLCIQCEGYIIIHNILCLKREMLQVFNKLFLGNNDIFFKNTKVINMSIFDTVILRHVLIVFIL